MKIEITLPDNFTGTYKKHGVEYSANFPTGKLTAEQVVAFAVRGMHEIVTNVSWTPTIVDPDGGDAVVKNPVKVRDAAKKAFDTFTGEGRTRLSEDVVQARKVAIEFIEGVGASKDDTAEAAKLVTKSFTRAASFLVALTVKKLKKAPAESDQIAMVNTIVESWKASGVERAEALKAASKKAPSITIDFTKK